MPLKSLFVSLPSLLVRKCRNKGPEIGISIHEPFSVMGRGEQNRTHRMSFTGLAILGIKIPCLIYLCIAKII